MRVANLRRDCSNNPDRAEWTGSHESNNGTSSGARLQIVRDAKCAKNVQLIVSVGERGRYLMQGVRFNQR
jgi:hypothetical protein